MAKVVDHNNVDTDNIEATISDTHIPGQENIARDTTPIVVNDIDVTNITHIENETSPNFVDDFISMVDNLVSSSNLKDRI